MCQMVTRGHKSKNRQHNVLTMFGLMINRKHIQWTFHHGIQSFSHIGCRIEKKWGFFGGTTQRSFLQIFCPIKIKWEICRGPYKHHSYKVWLQLVQ